MLEILLLVLAFFLKKYFFLLNCYWLLWIMTLNIYRWTQNNQITWIQFEYSFWQVWTRTINEIKRFFCLLFLKVLVPNFGSFSTYKFCSRLKWILEHHSLELFSRKLSPLSYYKSWMKATSSRFFMTRWW